VSQTAPQTYSDHRRLDPLFHLFVIPVFVLGLVLSLVHFFYHFRESDSRDNFHSFLLILLALALLTLVFKTRLYTLRVQDRVIRLEERLRLMQLLPDSLRARIPELTEDQLIGLRFASDAELAGLAQRALNEKLKRSDIKKAIQNWRPDNWRV
jgi:cellulose synthase/poly-beta-1,6-N-acetylglucosamine synthase-like glycosyltransferase